jgi:hypothetical protein
MFSNKSGELLRLVTVHRIAGRRVALFKHSLDDRCEGGGAVSTHQRGGRRGGLSARPIVRLLSACLGQTDSHDADAWARLLGDILMPMTYAEMMRTTIRMDDALLAQAKAEAVRSGRTLTQVIEDAVRESLARVAAAEPARRPSLLPTFAGVGLQPGVDLDSTDALDDLMDADGAD